MNNDKEKQIAEYHAHANAYDAVGCPILAGLLRVEAANLAERPENWRPIHKPSIGPYSKDNTCHCVNCGRPSNDPFRCDFGEGEDRYCDQKF